jgi:hypothetical protein
MPLSGLLVQLIVNFPRLAYCQQQIAYSKEGAKMERGYYVLEYVLCMSICGLLYFMMDVYYWQHYSWISASFMRSEAAPVCVFCYFYSMIDNLKIIWT